MANKTERSTVIHILRPEGADMAFPTVREAIDFLKAQPEEFHELTPGEIADLIRTLEPMAMMQERQAEAPLQHPGVEGILRMIREAKASEAPAPLTPAEMVAPYGGSAKRQAFMTPPGKGLERMLKAARAELDAIEREGHEVESMMVATLPGFPPPVIEIAGYETMQAIAGKRSLLILEAFEAFLSR